LPSHQRDSCPWVNDKLKRSSESDFDPGGVGFRGLPKVDLAVGGLPTDPKLFDSAPPWKAVCGSLVVKAPRDSNFKLAGPALEEVVIGPGSKRTHRASLFFHDPTRGALIVAAEHRAKVEAAFLRAASGVALGQQHVSFGLYIGKLLVQAKLLAAKLLLKLVYRLYECVF
jgi:hypothetical protein